MKKLIFTFSLFCAIAINSNAQTCGTPSGPSVCTPNGSLTAPGLAPISDSLPPIIDGADGQVTIQFENFDSIANPEIAGTYVHMDSLTVDSINNLPTGYCWSTSSATNTYGNQQQGCITVTGTPGTHQIPGQYELFIYVTVYTTPSLIGSGPLGPIPTSAAGLYYFVRVNCSDSATTQPIDTAGEENYSPLFRAYNDPNCNVGIPDIDKTVQSLNVYPNPFSTQTEIKFNSSVAGTMQEKLTDILGNTVYSKQIGVVAGSNSYTIERGSLAAGLYFYTISDGNSSLTKKLTITE